MLSFSPLFFDFYHFDHPTIPPKIIKKCKLLEKKIIRNANYAPEDLKNDTESSWRILIQFRLLRLLVVVVVQSWHFISSDIFYLFLSFFKLFIKNKEVFCRKLIEAEFFFFVYLHSFLPVLVNIWRSKTKRYFAAN